MFNRLLRAPRWPLLLFPILLLLPANAACGGVRDDARDDSRSAARDSANATSAPGDAIVSGDAADHANGPFGVLDGRKIVRNALIELSVESVTGAVDRVDAIASDAGGFVSRSNVFSEPQVEGEGGETRRTQTASVTIRVPAESYAGVMRDLRALGLRVDSETSEASEVTEEFTDLQARLRNLEATENQYLALLVKAEAIPDILTVQDRLNQVRLEIEQVQGRINVLDDLTARASITVELHLPPPVPESQFWLAEVVEAAVAVAATVGVVVVAGVVFGVISLGWVIPLVLLMTLVWRTFGRRAVALVRRVYEA